MPIEQAALDQPQILGRERLDRLAQLLERRPAGQLSDHVALAGRDRQLGADRRGALGDHRQHLDAVEPDAHRAFGDDLVADEQHRLVVGRAARGEPAEQRQQRGGSLRKRRTASVGNVSRVGEQDRRRRRRSDRPCRSARPCPPRAPRPRMKRAPQCPPRGSPPTARPRMPPSISRPRPITPPAPHPISASGASTSWIAASVGLRQRPDSRPRRRPRRGRSAHRRGRRRRRPPPPVPRCAGRGPSRGRCRCGRAFRGLTILRGRGAAKRARCPAILPAVPPPPRIVAVFGPTGVGKTAVAIALAERLRARGEDPVAVSADAMQVYEGLEILTGAATAAEQDSSSTACSASCRSRRRSPPARMRAWPTPRSTGCSRAAGARSSSAAPACTCAPRSPSSTCARRSPGEVRDRWSRAAGRARRRRAARRAAGRRPRPGSSPATRQRVHPRARAARRRPRPRRRRPRAPVAAVDRPHTRHPTLLAALVDGPRSARTRASTRRIDAMLRAGRSGRGRAPPTTAGASATARAALGFRELLDGDVEAMRIRTRRYAKRQLTWLRKLPGATRRRPHRPHAGGRRRRAVHGMI